MLGLIVTEALYVRHPDLPEGDLARMRAAVVSSASLAPLAAGLGLGGRLRLGRGEDNSGGREKPSLLADALEAVIGALYLGAGLPATQDFVLGLFATRLAEEAARAELGDAKNRLQELCARLGRPAPTYRTSEQGPDHAKRFSAVVSVEGAELGRGEGPSKKAAERAAAVRAVEALAPRGGGA